MLENTDQRTQEVLNRIANKEKNEFYVFRYFNNDEGKRQLSTVPNLLYPPPSDECYVELYRVLRDYLLECMGQKLKIYHRSNDMLVLCVHKGDESIPLAVLSEPIEGIEIVNLPPPVEIGIDVVIKDPT